MKLTALSIVQMVVASGNTTLWENQLVSATPNQKSTVKTKESAPRVHSLVPMVGAYGNMILWVS